MSFDFFTRLQTYAGRSNLCDRFSETYFNSTPLKLFFGISTQIVFERGEHFFPPVHNDYPRLFCGELVVVVGEKIIKEIRERASGLNTRRHGADNNKMERSVFNQSGVAIGGFKSFQNSVAKLDRIHEGV